MIKHKSETYYSTGKLGHTIDTDEPSAEYESSQNPGRRIWVTESGRIMED